MDVENTQEMGQIDLVGQSPFMCSCEGIPLPFNAGRGTGPVKKDIFGGSARSHCPTMCNFGVDDISVKHHTESSKGIPQ
jgi:hypothetical protein